MKISKSYLLQSFAILVMASGFFLFFKTYLPNKIFSETPLVTTNVVIDSLMIEALKKEDSLQLAAKSIKETPKAVVVPKEAEQTFKGLVYLDDFFEILSQIEASQKGKLRIAYFGDSMTDGDLIVQDLRKNFQQKYGGRGVGYVGITSESANSRGSVTHRYSTSWRTQSYLNVKRPSSPFGVNGQVVFTKDSITPTWIHFKAGTSQTMNALPNAKLYYGKSNNQKAWVSWVVNGDTITKKLRPTSGLNSLAIHPGEIKDLRVHFHNADSIPIYGFDFTSRDSGVQVDNFSSRGNSGLPLSLLQPALMSRFQQELQYDLIVLHYGTNVLNYGSYNYGWYTRQMSKVVDHIRTCFPNAAILVISTADKATKYDLHMQTDSAVLPLVKAQRRYAYEKHTGFFNLFEQMGGKGSMISWVETEPAKANKDYTHFNHRGAQQVGKMVFDYLELGYQDYKIRKQVPGYSKVQIAKVQHEPSDVAVEQVVLKQPVVEKDQIPQKKKEVAQAKPTLTETVSNSEVSKLSSSRYTVEQGDTYIVLSQKFGVSIESIKKANGLHGDALHAGWKITIPVAEKTLVKAKQANVHVVAKGETLGMIARKYHTTVSKLKKYNSLESRGIQPGQRLRLTPDEKQEKVLVEQVAVKKELTTLYEVKEGDTLTSLARRFNTTVQRLKELNNLGEDGIEIEQMILVPNTENEGN